MPTTIGQDKIELKHGQTVFTYIKKYAYELKEASWVEVEVEYKDGFYTITPKKDKDGNLIWKD